MKIQFDSTYEFEQACERTREENDHRPIVGVQSELILGSDGFYFTGPEAEKFLVAFQPQDVIRRYFNKLKINVVFESRADRAAVSDTPQPQTPE